jgi:hypothetical protein
LETFFTITQTPIGVRTAIGSLWIAVRSRINLRQALFKKSQDIRDEIAKLDDPGSPERCCCIHVTCSEENGHERGQCKTGPA